MNLIISIYLTADASNLVAPPFDPAKVKLGNLKDKDKIAAKIREAELEHASTYRRSVVNEDWSLALPLAWAVTTDSYNGTVSGYRTQWDLDQKSSWDALANQFLHILEGSTQHNEGGSGGALIYFAAPTQTFRERMAYVYATQLLPRIQCCSKCSVGAEPRFSRDAICLGGHKAISELPPSNQQNALSLLRGLNVSRRDYLFSREPDHSLHTLEMNYQEPVVHQADITPATEAELLQLTNTQVKHLAALLL